MAMEYMIKRMFAILVLMPALSFSEGVTVSINYDDGGKTSDRHFNKLLTALQGNGCDVKQVGLDQFAQLLFDPTPRAVAFDTHVDYELIAIAKTLTGAVDIRGAIVVQASTGITDLNTLKGNWFSFISQSSWTGYILPLKLLNSANINEDNSHFYFVGNHFGSAAALGHQDVQVAIIAEPLAKRWANLNNLSIIAVTEAVETGGWWVHKDVPSLIKSECAKALTQLNKSDHTAVPAWIDGFKAVSAEL